ncbi:MAG: RecB family exonuclease [Actinomycetota bacterium]|nr:PD-(D/E)XK nuclease family protein [Actinomycetota bacterium]
MEELTLDFTGPSDIALAEPVEENPIRLSYSSISTYELCPLQYKFKYVEREPGIRTPALAFGESLHEALRLFHHQPVPVAPSLGQLLGYLDQAWDATPYSDEREERTYKDHARQVMSAYHRANAPRFVMPVTVEQRFEIPIGDVTVTGIIDRMDRHPDGSYEIIDYKTNRRLPPKKIVERDLQLSIYYLAAQEVWGITPRWVTMYYLLPGQRITVTRTEADGIATRERIADVAARIAAGEFRPTENRLCNWCDYKAKCPLFAHESRRVQQPDPVDISGAVEEWIKLQRKAKSDAVRLAQLSTVIHDYCAAEGLDRLFGEDAAVTRTASGDGLWSLSLKENRR